MVVDSAHGDQFDAYYAKPISEASSSSLETADKSMLKPYFDGSASWFTCATLMDPAWRLVS
jgi:dethiobiotin synthetase/adenosylmethionine--8-amino-7-oxononanoate aminotransferase